MYILYIHKIEKECMHVEVIDRKKPWCWEMLHWLDMHLVHNNNNNNNMNIVQWRSEIRLNFGSRLIYSLIFVHCIFWIWFLIDFQWIAWLRVFVCVCAVMLLQTHKYLLLSSNRLNGSGNNGVDLAGPFILMVMNGFLLFFISLNSLFISYCAFGLGTFTWCLTTGTFTWCPTTGTFTWCATTGTCTGTDIGTCTGTGTCIFTGTLTPFCLTKVAGIWFTVAATVSFRDVR